MSRKLFSTNNKSPKFVNDCENLIQAKLCLIVVSLLFQHISEGQERSDFSDHRGNSLWKLCCTCERDLLHYQGRNWLKRAAVECLHFK